MVAWKKIRRYAFRSSLVKVDGFKNSDDFEKFVNDTNIKANLLLKKEIQLDLIINTVLITQRRFCKTNLN